MTLRRLLRWTSQNIPLHIPSSMVKPYLRKQMACLTQRLQMRRLRIRYIRQGTMRPHFHFLDLLSKRTHPWVRYEILRRKRKRGKKGRKQRRVLPAPPRPRMPLHLSPKRMGRHRHPLHLLLRLGPLNRQDRLNMRLFIPPRHTRTHTTGTPYHRKVASNLPTHTRHIIPLHMHMPRTTRIPTILTSRLLVTRRLPQITHHPLRTLQANRPSSTPNHSFAHLSIHPLLLNRHRPPERTSHRTRR